MLIMPARFASCSFPPTGDLQLAQKCYRAGNHDAIRAKNE